MVTGTYVRVALNGLAHVGSLGDAHPKAVAPHVGSTSEVLGHSAGNLDRDRGVLVLLAEDVDLQKRATLA